MSAEPDDTGTTGSDQQFWLLFAHSNVGMAIVLPNGRFERANAEFCRLLDYSEEQLKLLDLQTVTHRNDLSAEMRLIKAGLKGKSPSYSLEKRFVRNNGTIILASVSSTIVPNQAGSPLHSIYTAHAILPLSLDDRVQAADDATPDTQHLSFKSQHPSQDSQPPAPTALEYEDRLFQFLESVPVGLYVIDGAGQPYYANMHARELLGIGVDPNAPHADPLAGARGLYIAGTDQPYPEERMPIVRALYGDRSSIEDMEIGAAGHAVPVQSWGAPVYDTAGQVAFAVAAFRDITQRKASQGEVQMAHDRYMAICDNLKDLVTVHDLRGIYRFASHALTDLTGYEAQELVGTDARVYIHPEDLPIVGKTFQRYMAGSDEHMRATYRFRRKDGEYSWVETSARPVIGTYGLHREILCVTRDLTDTESNAGLSASLLRESNPSASDEKEQQMLALLDTLTGVNNRSALDEHLQKNLASRRASTYPLGCLLIDVDNFQQINNKYGRETGDEVLKKVASIISNACRGEDFVGRYSTDEFVVLLSNTDAAGTVVVGEKLISNVRSAYWAGTPVTESITISVGGVCISRYTGLTESDLLEMLDAQLYEAKQGGRNRMVMNARRTVSGQWAALTGK